MRWHTKPWLLGGGWPRPALDLDLRRLDNRIAITRAGNATFFDSAGFMRTAGNNVARHDHDPVTGEALGILIEGSATNLFKASEDFSSVWLRQSSTIDSTTIVGPDGEANAFAVDFGGVASNIYQASISVASSTQYTVTVYLSTPAGTPPLELRSRAIGDVSGLIFGGHSMAAIPGGEITLPAAGVWTRYKKTFTTGASDTTIQWRFEEGIGQQPGDSIVHMAKPQFELDVESSYLETTVGETASRVADAAQITDMSWFNANAGAFLVEAHKPFVAGISSYVFSVNDGSGGDDDRFDVYLNDATNKSHLLVQNAGVTQIDSDVGNAWTDGESHKFAFAYATNDVAAVDNGGTVVTDSSATFPSVDRMDIGSNQVQGSQFDGHIKRIRYWSRRLPNGLLQSLTS